MSHTIPLRSGTLHLEVEHAELPLTELCGFGTRRSRKRGFLFISKVLGKHIPVDPLRMEWTHRRLAELLLAEEVLGPVVLIALAETATALGQGVFEHCLEQSGREDFLFLTTTRYRLNRPLALTFDESHSHATEHLLYQPADPENSRLFASARSLVLVDDEISSGRTLVNLAREYQRLYPSLEVVHLVCLTDWLGAKRRAEIEAELQVRVCFHHLLRGEFRFDPDESFDPGPLPDVRGKGDLKDAIIHPKSGRQGVRRRLECWQYSEQSREPTPRTLVLGTGEFSYLPFLTALLWRRQGRDVVYQATTRSPILVGEDIASVLEFVDNYGDEIPNYVYNVTDKKYDAIVIGYETHPLPRSHRLREMLGAEVRFYASNANH